MKQSNNMYLKVLFVLVTALVLSGCERNYDIPWPQAGLNIYKVEDGAKTEITSARIGEQIIFAKPEKSVTDFNRIFKFSLWPGDEGHEFDKIYDPGQQGIVFPGVELPYTYATAGTYDVVYVISYYNTNEEELERKTVIKTITISE